MSTRRSTSSGRLATNCGVNQRLYRALVPKRFGGGECSSAAFCQMIERISHGDGSAGWVASFGMNRCTWQRCLWLRWQRFTAMVVGLGVARAALDELRGMASGRISVPGEPALADRPLAQGEIAKAEAALLAARAFFHESIDRAWPHVLAGDPVPQEVTNLLRLSSTHASRISADVARTEQMLSGMTGVYVDSPLARCVNDANVVTQHAFMGDVTYQNAGAIFFDTRRT